MFAERFRLRKHAAHQLPAFMRLTASLLLVLCVLHRPPELSLRRARNALQEGRISLHTVHQLHLHGVRIWRRNRGEKTEIHRAYLMWINQCLIRSELIWKGRNDKRDSFSEKNKNEEENTFYRNISPFYPSLHFNYLPQIWLRNRGNCSYTVQPLDGVLLLPAEDNTHRRSFTV